MRRAILFLSGSIFIISALRLVVPQLTTQFFAFDAVIAILGLCISGLAFISNVNPLRFLDLRTVFKAMAIALFVLGAYSINSPTLGDLRQTYLPIMDIFMLIECSIILGLLGTEAADESAIPPLTLLAMTIHMLTRPYAQRLASSSLVSRSKIAQ